MLTPSSSLVIVFACNVNALQLSFFSAFQCNAKRFAIVFLFFILLLFLALVSASFFLGQTVKSFLETCYHSLAKKDVTKM